MIANTHLTPNAVRYAWQQIAQRAGVDCASAEPLSLMAFDAPVHYANPEQVPTDSPGVIICPCSHSSWLRLLQAGDSALKQVCVADTHSPSKHLPFADAVPVLLWGDGYEAGQKPFVEERTDGTIIFYADILAATFLLLTRQEEWTSTERDAHDRFPAHASLAHRYHFLERPLVDEYALILQAWLQVLRPGWQPPKPSLTVKLSHDIDWVSHFSTVKAGALRVYKDLRRRRDPLEAWRSLSKVFDDVVAPTTTVPMQGIRTLAEMSEQFGLTSAFYFMAARPTYFDSGYSIASRCVRETIEALQAAGHEVGWHPSYFTLNNPELLGQEKTRIDAVLGGGPYGGRQHYLRFRAPDTWRHWNELGLQYDSTLGFADAPGFRCGTCHPFPVFDVQNDTVLELVELPLIVMDGTLANYLHLSPDDALGVIRTLARRCRAVGGTFTLLWHNTALAGTWEPWARYYPRILSELVKLQD